MRSPRSGGSEEEKEKEKEKETAVGCR